MELVYSKQFRENLYCRINVIELIIPPLRERRDDIPILIDYFMTSYCDKIGFLKKTVSNESMDILCNYKWKGNIRELQNTIEYMCSDFNKMDSLERKEIFKALEKYGYTTVGNLRASKSIGISRSSL